MEARTGFAQLVRAEWTKFRTVRGWVVTAIVVAVVIAVAMIDIAGISRDDNTPPALATGPDGESVTDAFYFVHQPLSGDGSITVRVTALINIAEQPSPGSTPRPGGHGGTSSRTAACASIQPWAKAGIIVKDSTTPGSRYAARGGPAVRRLIVGAGHAVVRAQRPYKTSPQGQVLAGHHTPRAVAPLPSGTTSPTTGRTAATSRVMCRHRRIRDRAPPPGRRRYRAAGAPPRHAGAALLPAVPASLETRR